MSEKVSRAKEFTSKAVEGGLSRPPQHNNNKHDFKGKGKFQNKNGPNPQIQKKKGNFFIYVVQTEEIIAVVVCKAHLAAKVKGWVVDSACTRHIGAFK